MENAIKVYLISLLCSYFQNLVASFEAKMQLYRRQIEELESHLQAISPEAGMSSQSEQPSMHWDLTPVKSSEVCTLGEGSQC